MEAGKPSRTAEYVALFRALETLRPAAQRQFQDPQARSFLRPSLRFLMLLGRITPLRAGIEAYIDRRWPGPRPSAVARTRVIDDFLTDAVGEGCAQVVLLGAGYDTRASRLEILKGIAVFEVDHPSTQAHKRGTIGSGPASVRYVPIDFERDPLDEALRRGGLDTNTQTALVWEGVFSYLSPEAIDRTLHAVTSTCPPGSRILITYVDRAALDERTAAGAAWLQAVENAGEPFRTGLDPASAPGFFAGRGLTLRHDESTREAAHRLGISGAIPDFYRLATLVVAEQARTAASAPSPS